MKRFIKKIINTLGFDIVRYISPLERNLGIDETLGFELENEATDAIQVVRLNTMLSKRRLVTLFQQVVYCELNNIPGALVECGVWKGGAVGIMALANLYAGKMRRSIHLFDSFQEICQPDATVDGERALREVEEFKGISCENNSILTPVTGIYDFLGGAGTLDENRNLLEKIIKYPVDLIHYHAGWFQETLPAEHESITEIAVLRLDGDWYASTKICLEYLFTKVVKGGVVIIDDYGTYEGCRLAVDEFIKAQKINVYLGSIDSDCRFFIKP